MKQSIESITYFAEEGRGNLEECLRLSFETLSRFGLSKLVIFTGFGEGIRMALEQYLCLPEYKGISVIGVTFPQGFEGKRDGEQVSHVFPDAQRREFLEKGVTIVRAHLPFDSISTQYQNQHGVLAQDMGIVGNALNIFCGSMSLCVQAALVACDAGEVEAGEHIVVMTSDTSLLLRAAPTTRLLTDLIVRQIVCKPAFLTIVKSEKLEGGPQTELESESTLDGGDLLLES